MPAADDVQYFEAVNRDMIHVCSCAVNGCLDKDGCCKRGYKNRAVVPLTMLDDNGYPVYRRRNERDFMVVPHNRELLLDWDGHINVEFAGSSFTVLYLYKYLFKGNKKVKARLVDMNISEEERKDEHGMYLRGRMICAMDSMWRYFGFHTYPATKPSVSKISVKIPSHVEMLLNDGKLCDMGVYFARPQLFAAYKYTEFFANFSYSRTLPARFRGTPIWTTQNLPQDIDMVNVGNVCIDITAKFSFLTYLGKHLYLFSKDPSKPKSIVRMNWFFPTAREIFYLRILLFHFPAMSFEEYRTVDGIVHATFQTAAVARGYVTDENEALLAFHSVILLSTPAELRALLVLMTVEGFPTLCIIQNEELFKTMYDDYLHFDAQCSGNVELSKNKCLLDLKRRFDVHGKDIMHACGFPTPICTTEMTELDRIRLKYNPEQQKAKLERAMLGYPNTPEQDAAFDLIKGALTAKKRLLIFVQGSAGTGKSTFAKKIAAYARSKGLIALGCAATALAAQVYGEEEEYTTAHDLFGIPVVEDTEDLDHDAEIISLYLHQADKLELLRAASVLIWDEVLSNHKHCLSTAFSIMDNFQGQVLVLMGDWRQCPPVVPNGDMYEVVNASMINSRFWPMFKIVKFTTNLRLLSADETDKEFNTQQREYLQMLDIIGEGIEPTSETSGTVVNVYSENVHEDGSMVVALPQLKHISDKGEALQWLFPDGFDADSMHTRAILCSTNVIVDEWNATIQELNPNPIYELRSEDKVKDIDDPHGILRRMISESVLERFQRPGVPHHKLYLKKNDICMVMRTLNRKEGLTKNLRVKILDIQPYMIRVCTLNPTNRKFYNIPRIRFSVTLPYGRSVSMERKQFPLRLAYSITYNKSQGQEFQQVLVDIRNNPFTHGHLYVALSRIRIASTIRLFTMPATLPLLFSDDPTSTTEEFFTDPPVVTNVVYKLLSLN